MAYQSPVEMADVVLYFATSETPRRSVDLIRSVYQPDSAQPISSGFQETESWHGTFNSLPFGARIVFEKLFQLSDLQGSSPSSVIRQCNGTKALNKLAVQIGEESPSLNLILFGHRKANRLGKVFEVERGKDVRVEFRQQSAIESIRVFKGSEEVPHEFETYVELLGEMGFSIEVLSRLARRRPDEIPLAELGPYLKSFRELEEDVGAAHILQRFVDEAPEIARSFDTVEKVSELEAGSIDRRISLQDAEKFCSCYRASRIVADWLASEPVESRVKLSVFSPTDFRPLRDRANGCQYLTPRYRLIGTDSAIVVCKLDGMKDDESSLSKSDSHFHPGDELTIVLKGAVEFRLNSIGVVQHLSEFDFIHFEAEHPHVVVNPHEIDAVFLSIRVPRLLGESTRRRFWAVLKEAANDLNHIDEELPETADLIGFIAALGRAYPSQTLLMELRRRMTRLRRITSWLLKLRKPANCLEGTPTIVRDFESLRRRAKGLVDYQRDRGKVVGRLTDNRLRNVLAGNEQELKIPDLQEMCKQLKVPFILLYDTLIPSVQTLSSISEPAGWVSPPPRTGATGTYRLPRRKLLGADIDVLRLELKAGESCPLNDHPGFELILCIKGIARIRFSTQSTQISPAESPPTGSKSNSEIELAPFEFCHFDSTVPHEVANPHDKLATELVVIRFLDPRYLPFFED